MIQPRAHCLYCGQAKWLSRVFPEVEKQRDEMVAQRDEFSSLALRATSAAEKIKLERDQALALLREAAEAMSMGAFHHDACAWLRGGECCCANSKVKAALTRIDESGLLSKEEK